MKVDSTFGIYENTREQTKIKENKFDRQNSSTQKLRRNRYGGARRIKKSTVYSRQSSRPSKLNRQSSLATKLSGCHLYEEVKTISRSNNDGYQELVKDNKTGLEEGPIYMNFVALKCPTFPTTRQRSGNYTELTKTGNNINDTCLLYTSPSPRDS